ERLGVEPELPHAAGDEERRRRFYRRVAERDVLAAAPATPAEDDVREEWDVFVPRQLVPAGHARRPGADDRPPQRNARCDDVEERAEGQSGREREDGEAHRYLTIVIGSIVTPTFGGSGAPTGMFLMTGSGFNVGSFAPIVIVPMLIGPWT